MAFSLESSTFSHMIAILPDAKETSQTVTMLARDSTWESSMPIPELLSIFSTPKIRRRSLMMLPTFSSFHLAHLTPATGASAPFSSMKIQWLTASSPRKKSLKLWSWSITITWRMLSSTWDTSTKQAFQYMTYSRTPKTPMISSETLVSIPATYWLDSSGVVASQEILNTERWYRLCRL